MDKKVLILGASGLVGSAAVRRFASTAGWQVVAASRRLPMNLPEGVEFLPVDLSSADSVSIFSALSDVTHVVYAAINEDSAALTEGWRDRERMDLNLAMLGNVLDPLIAARAPLRHVTVMQGMKAYGIHVDPDVETPMRENRPRHGHANFYWLQEDHVRALQSGSAWSWTIFRPPMIIGDAVGSNLNVLLALAVYATLQREAGRPFGFPGHARQLAQALDVDLLADAFVWAAQSEAARNQIFNIDNGEVFSWRDLWPLIGQECGVEATEDGPPSLSADIAGRDEEWARIVCRYNLVAQSRLADFSGSFALADNCLGSVPYQVANGIMSSIKLRQAGFAGCVDTEEMTVRWLRQFRGLRLIV